jgi:hypothetical protein
MQADLAALVGYAGSKPAIVQVGMRFSPETLGG